MEITCYQLCYTTAAAHGYSIPGRKIYQCDYQNHAVRPVCGATNHLCAALCFPALYCLFLLGAVEQARRRFPTRASCANAQTSTLRSGWQSDAHQDCTELAQEGTLEARGNQSPVVVLPAVRGKGESLVFLCESIPCRRPRDLHANFL